MPALDSTAHRLVVTGRALTSSAGSVGIFDTTSGRLLRQTALHDVEGGLPLVDSQRGMAFVAMTGRASGVVIVDTRSGTVRHVTALGTVARVDLVLSRCTGRIYAATLDGHGLWRRGAIDEWSGRILSTVSYPRAMGSMLALAIDERRGLFFAAYTQEFPVPGSVPAAVALQVIDARSGHVRRIFPLGTGAAHLAVNERAGRLILLTMGGFDTIKPRDEWAWMPGWLRGRVPGIPPPPVQLQSGTSVTVVDTTRL